MFAECWWTPAKIGLLAGFSGMATFFCLCCIGWKCICEPKNQVGDEYEVDEDDADEDENGKQVGHPSNGLSAIHDIVSTCTCDAIFVHMYYFQRQWVAK